jgi:hypothetical protein
MPPACAAVRPNAAKALTSSSMQGNPVPLSQDDLAGIVLAAL